jgi:hypothetical protein
MVYHTQKENKNSLSSRFSEILNISINCLDLLDRSLHEAESVFYS